jgi:hypothetical protein
MVADLACRCCGLGIALANFKGLHAAFNFESASIGRNTTDEGDGWQRWRVDQLDKYGSGAVNTSIQTGEINRVAFKFDADAEVVLVQVRLIARRSGTERWRWDLSYEIPTTTFDDLVANGRLTLNPFLTSAVHSGNQSDFFTLIQSLGIFVPVNVNVSGATNNPDDLGDIALTWPPFEFDWSDKRLLFSLTAENPIVPALSFPEYQAVNLAWASQQFEFVFDDTTLQPSYDSPSSPFFRQLYVDRQTHAYASECWNYIEAQHTGYVVNNPRDVGESSFLAADLVIRFGTSPGCNYLGTPDAPASAFGFEPLQMTLGVTGIFWKAFAVNNVLEVTEYFLGSPAISPVLARLSGFIYRALFRDQAEIGSAVLRLEIADLE